MNPDELDIGKTPEVSSSTIDIDTDVAQTYFEEAEAMNIGRITKGRFRAAGVIIDQACPSSTNERGGRRCVRTPAGVCATVASARRVLTRRTTIACNIVDGNDDEREQEEEDFNNGMVYSSPNYIENYDATTTESSNDDGEDETD